MDEVIVLCPAKINLFLNIVGKVYDMHLLKMLNQSVNLYDYLIIKPNPMGYINITCKNMDLPVDENNSCLKAVMAMKGIVGIDAGFDIELTKNIPIGAGLGGESTDAAGVILGIKELFGINLTNEELISIGSQIGADVPFCLTGGTALVEGFGEKITKAQTYDFKYLIIKPNFEISTRDAFYRYDLTCTEYKEFNGIVYGLNDFEIVSPEIIQFMRHQMVYNGAHFSNMTGTGSSVIGAFPNKTARLKGLRAMKKICTGCQIFSVDSCQGVEVLKKSRLN